MRPFFRDLARLLARYLSEWADPPQPAPPPPDPVLPAVEAACRACGLPRDISLDFDLLASGKLPEVLYHTAKALDADGSFRTVADVCEAFR